MKFNIEKKELNLRHVILEKDKIIIKGNGEGMDEGLKFFTLHGENQDMKTQRKIYTSLLTVNTFLISTIKIKLFEVRLSKELKFEKSGQISL